MGHFCSSCVIHAPNPQNNESFEERHMLYMNKAATPHGSKSYNFLPFQFVRSPWICVSVVWLWCSLSSHLEPVLAEISLHWHHLYMSEPERQLEPFFPHLPVDTVLLSQMREEFLVSFGPGFRAISLQLKHSNSDSSHWQRAEVPK